MVRSYLRDALIVCHAILGILDAQLKLIRPIGLVSSTTRVLANNILVGVPETQFLQHKEPTTQEPQMEFIQKLMEPSHLLKVLFESTSSADLLDDGSQLYSRLHSHLHRSIAFSKACSIDADVVYRFYTVLVYTIHLLMPSVQLVPRAANSSMTNVAAVHLDRLADDVIGSKIHDREHLGTLLLEKVARKRLGWIFQRFQADNRLQRWMAMVPVSVYDWATDQKTIRNQEVRPKRKRTFLKGFQIMVPGSMISQFEL
jgi:hypothetical protein